MPVALEGTDFVVMLAGVLDDTHGAQPFRHIFVSQNPAWAAISDDLPQFSEHVPREQMLPRRDTTVRIQVNVPATSRATAIDTSGP